MIVGNVVEDLLSDGSKAPGGPSLYSAWVASALDVEVTLCSRVPAGYDERALRGLNLVRLPAVTCPLFSNSYDGAGNRTQFLYELGEPIQCSDIPAARGEALLVAPAYHELDCVPIETDLPRATVVMLQAALRTIDGQSQVRPTLRPLPVTAPFLVPNGTVVFSEEDAGDPLELAGALSERGTTVLVTLGPRGVRVFQPGAPSVTVPGYHAEITDPTGAGDAFAAAFTIRLTETGDLIEACRFANAAGSLAVEGSGRESVPTRPRVEERMLQGVA